MATQLDALFVEIFFKGDQRALDNFKRGWKQLDDRIKNTQQTLDRFAKRFAVAGAIGSAAMGLIGKAGLDTEEALLRTRAALSLTEDQMRTLHEEALKVGSQLPLNTKDIVNAQLAYGKLGATFEEIIRDAPAIAGAAVATDLNPEQVATYARIIQNVFGGDVQENLDMLLRTANRSPSTFAALGESIQFSGQAAVDAGMDFRTYLATLGSTAGAGRSVESVSQGMAAMFGRLALATENTGVGGKRLIDVFGDVGINFRDVKAAMDGTSEGFINVLRLMNEAELSTTQLTALLSTLAGHSYAASISYAVQNPEKLDELLAEIDSSTGEIVRQQEIILSGASGGIKEMMAQIDTLLNRLAQLGVLTAIEKFTRGISRLVSWLTATNKEEELVRGGLLRMVTIMGGLLAALLPLGIALKAVSFALSGLVPLLKAAAWANTKFGISAKFAAIANSNFILSLRLAAINVRAYVANLILATLWNSNFVVSLRLAAINVRAYVASLSLATLWNSNFVVSLRLAAINVRGFATTIWTSTITALIALGRRLAMASLAMLRFATRAIVAGISAVITFGVAIWASLIPPLIAATAAVVGFTLALLANPVVLIVAAIIGAFVALGFVVYKFRRQILGALKTALSWAKENWPLLVGILFGPFGIAAGLIFKFRDDIVGAIMWIKDRVTSIFTSLRDFIIGIWEGLGEGLAGAFRGVINAVINGLNKALEVAAGLLEGIKGALDKIPGPNPAGDFLLGVASKLRAGLPNLAIGGIVPGPLGRPLLATVHGGEMVLPVGASRVIAQMLEGFRLGPAALPQAPHYYGQMYRSSVVNRSVTVNITEPIVIHTQATDAKGIAQEIGEAIQDQIRNIAYDHDGPVER